MDELSDGQLLATWQGGDPGAFEHLVRRHEAALLRHARSMLGDLRSGEDVVQEVFLRLIQRPPTIPDTARGDARAESAVLSSWLHQVTRNLCMDTQRGERRRRKREEEVASRETIAGSQNRVEAADTRAAVERGLEKLPAQQREVLVLRLFGDRSYQEIAAITGRKVGTVGWMISVGLKALATELEGLMGKEGQASRAIGPQAARVTSLRGEVS
jgi:RNA polymerase sigma-70 factor (ECF subfamily)